MAAVDDGAKSRYALLGNRELEDLSQHMNDKHKVHEL